MKEKIIYIVTVVLSFFVGIIGTLLFISQTKIFEPVVEKEEEKDKIINVVEIKENDTIKPAVDKVYDSVVLIETYRGSRLAGTGTGFIYKKEDKKGYIITNNHVIERATKIVVINNSGLEIEATLLGGDEYADIAVLSIDEEGVMAVAEIGSSVDLNLGDTLFTVGSPLGKEYMGTVTKGILSGKDRRVNVDLSNGNYIMEVIQTDAAINPGNSGGPLVNINGQVIGVNSLKLVKDEVEGMGFAIPIEIVMSSVEKLEKGEEVLRPVIGIEIIDVKSTYDLYRNNIILSENFDQGLVIVSTVVDFPADKAGLQKGDVLLEVNGTKIQSIGHFRFLLYKFNVGDTIKVKYYRDGKISEAQVKLDKSINDNQ